MAKLTKKLQEQFQESTRLEEKNSAKSVGAKLQ